MIMLPMTLPRRLRGLTACLLGLGVGGGLAVPTRANEATQSPFRASTLAQRQPLVIGTVTDTYPYSYVGPDGRIAGFGADIFEAVCRAVNLQTTRVAGPAADIRERFQNDEFDALEYHGVSPQAMPYAEFSVPFLTLQGCIFVRKGGPVHSIRDLQGRPFAIISTRGQVEQLLRASGVTPRIVMLPTQEAILQRLSTGEVDGCFVSQLTELAISTKDHLRNLEILGRPYNGYDIKLAFAVHAGDAELLARLDEGLAIIHHTGEYDQIYRKNFSQYGSYILSAGDLELYVSAALGCAFVAALGGYFHQRRLRRELLGQASTLAEQGALLQALYDNIPVALTLIETRPGPRRVLSMNREAAVLYSVELPREGLPLEALPVSADIRRLLAEATDVMPGAPMLTTREAQLKAGKRFLEVIAVPLRAAGASGAERICVLVDDITDRKLQDAEMARSRRLRAVGELVGGIAHEFNNLLTPVMLKAGEIQLSRPDDAELQGDVEVIATAVQRTAELTRRLLTFGRKVEARSESVRLEAIAAGCFDLLKHTIDRRIAWEHRIPPGLSPLYFNATDLNQILLNLLLNARDALMDRLAGRNPDTWSPRITLEAEQLPPGAHAAPPSAGDRTLLGWQLLTVRDNGLGMAPDVVERIFEPFFTTKDVGKGTGLGLATVWHLVNDAGGQVKVESVLGAGSAFLILLPIWPPVEPAAAAAAGAVPVGPARILLVEDEVLVSRPVVELLHRAGHQVTPFADGILACRHLEANPAAFDLLVVDVNLPGMNGIDLVTRAREMDFPGRILMVSGRFTTADMSALTRLRIDHSISKPFDAQQFMAAVNRSLAGRRP
jgi:two-component system, cell cycle sensor histidine kinase and response regulator CckA